MTQHLSGFDSEMALVPGVHAVSVADIEAAVRVASTMGAAIFAFSTQGASTRADFFDAVRASLPLDPPLVGSRSWDALSDSLWGGIEALDASIVLITWTGAADLQKATPYDYDTAISVLWDLTSSLGHQEEAASEPKLVSVYVT